MDTVAELMGVLRKLSRRGAMEKKYYSTSDLQNLAPSTGTNKHEQREPPTSYTRFRDKANREFALHSAPPSITTMDDLHVKLTRPDACSVPMIETSNKVCLVMVEICSSCSTIIQSDKREIKRNISVVIQPPTQPSSLDKYLDK